MTDPEQRECLFRQDPHGAPIGTGGKGGVGLQRCCDVALAGSGRLPAGLVLFGAALRQFLLGDGQMDRPIGNVDLNRIAFTHQADRAAAGGFRRNVPDG